MIWKELVMIGFDNNKTVTRSIQISSKKSMRFNPIIPDFNYTTSFPHPTTPRHSRPDRESNWLYSKVDSRFRGNDVTKKKGNGVIIKKTRRIEYKKISFSPPLDILYILLQKTVYKLLMRGRR